MLLRAYHQTPDISRLPLRSKTTRLALDRLVLGVDNVRFDVHLSPHLRQFIKNFAYQLIAKHAQISETPGIKEKFNWIEEIHELKRLYQSLMEGAINKARVGREIQLDFLAQTAVVTLVIKETRNQFNTSLRLLKDLLRTHELHKDYAMIHRLKTELNSLRQSETQVLLRVREDLMQYLTAVHRSRLTELREVNFGPENTLTDEIFTNPILYAGNPFSNRFLVEEYLLLGHRTEDPLGYEFILDLLKQLLQKGLLLKNRGAEAGGPNGEAEAASTEAVPRGPDTSVEDRVSAWLQEPENLDLLFNYHASREIYSKLKKQKADRERLNEIKARIRTQKRLLRLLRRQFRKNKLMDKVLALYELQTVYPLYCPPMLPHEVLRYLVAPKSRRAFRHKLSQLKKTSSQVPSLGPLHKSLRNLKKIAPSQEKKLLVRFVGDFIRYHRDFRNFGVLKAAMDRVHLVSQDKLLKLSRANNTLYEFLLPHEHSADEGQIINHVVLKADVRGSTDIVHQMKLKGLNPASTFSLNYFDPITELLGRYGAVKVFIEGDAIILSIFEHEHTPENWYCVARACGLAINILRIVDRYNAKNLKYRLPLLVLGIGVAHSSGAPTFFFDGDNRIMISPAIHHADRLSRCEKALRKLYIDKKRPFNLYLFQTATTRQMARTTEDLYLRYNVKGINLSVSAFTKLSKEIKLTLMQFRMPQLSDDKLRIYTGRFPTVDGRYQRLVIREAHIPEVDPETLEVKRMTRRKYYEVCTHPLLYQYVRRRL